MKKRLGTCALKILYTNLIDENPNPCLRQSKHIHHCLYFLSKEQVLVPVPAIVPILENMLIHQQEIPKLMELMMAMKMLMNTYTNKHIKLLKICK